MAVLKQAEAGRPVPDLCRPQGVSKLYLHYGSDDANAQPNCGHLKNQDQALLGGPDFYRTDRGY